MIGSTRNPETIDPPLYCWTDAVSLDQWRTARLMSVRTLSRLIANIGHFNLVHETKKLSMTSVGRAGSRLRLATFLIVFAALAASHRGASAEAGYPNKSVRIVLPFAAGGVADITARIVAEKLGDKLGQRFYVENQPGAGGIAAARTVIASAPDGYTLALLSNGTAVSVSLFKKLPFDPLRDFEPISSLALQLRFCFEVRALGGGLVSSTPE